MDKKLFIFTAFSILTFAHVFHDVAASSNLRRFRFRRQAEAEGAAEVARPHGAQPEATLTQNDTFAEIGRFSAAASAATTAESESRPEVGVREAEAAVAVAEVSSEAEAEEEEADEEVERVVDVCATWDRLCDQICLSTSEGGYQCACRDGFNLAEDARTCVRGDVDAAASAAAVEGDAAAATVVVDGDGGSDDGGGGAAVVVDASGPASSSSSSSSSTLYRQPVNPRQLSNDRCQSAATNHCSQICRDTGLALVCDCETGFVLAPDLRTCLDVDECEEESHECSSDVRCVNTRGGYQCVLQSGRRTSGGSFGGSSGGSFVGYPGNGGSWRPGTFWGDRNGDGYRQPCPRGFKRNEATRECDDINECASLAASCLEGQRCENTRGGYRCVRENPCGTGYTLNGDTQRCTDNNECTDGTHNCGPAFTCTNTQGSFRCIARQCPEGSLLNYSTGTCDRVNCAVGYRATYGGTCVDVNECRSGVAACKNHERCVNTVGSFICQSLIQCRPGFQISELGPNCVDVDECSNGSHKCFPDQNCVNEPGGYRCVCPKGFRINRYTKQCEDLNECLHYGAAVCSAQAVCENTPGSYTCTCNAGFESSGDGRNCRDINECLSPNHGCEHKCSNTWGSYQCTCDNGYEKTIDGPAGTCQDIDECERFHENGRGRLCLGICNNTPGSFECACPPGFELMNDRRTCADIDECGRGTAECTRDDQVCVNTRGGFRCNGIVCPEGYETSPGSRNRCQRSSLICAREDRACLTAPLSYSHNFLSFPSKIRIPADLFTMRGPFSNIQRLQFDLRLISAKDPLSGEQRVARDFFYLKHFRDNEAVVSLLRQIDGPQDVELELEMKIFTNGRYSGTAVAKIFLYVTKNEF